MLAPSKAAAAGMVPTGTSIPVRFASYQRSIATWSGLRPVPGGPCGPGSPVRPGDPGGPWGPGSPCGPGGPIRLSLTFVSSLLHGPERRTSEPEGFAQTVAAAGAASVVIASPVSKAAQSGRIGDTLL